MHFHLITIFPEMFDSYMNESILRRAIDSRDIKISFYNPRDFTEDKHKKVDDRPYGGGPGMVLKAEPIVKAWKKAKGRKKKVKTLIMSPGGKEFTNRFAGKLKENFRHLIIICGRYEGIDARVKKITDAQEVSIGNYVLTGGELPAMVVVDAVARQVEGVLGNLDSIEENRISSGEMYTKPQVIKYKGKEYDVPKILLSGHHKKIAGWKKKRSR